MIDAGPSLNAAKNLSAAALATYLRSTGWTVQRSRVSGVTVLSKQLPEADGPIHIVLPEAAGFTDELRRVADALRTVEAVEERSMQAIVDDVRRIAEQSGKNLGRGARAADQKTRQGRSRKDTGSCDISDLDAIDAVAAQVLNSKGIKTTTQLLAATNTRKKRLTLASETEIDEKKLLNWANLADRMRIKGISAEYAELLQAAGVDTVKDLKYRNPAILAKAMADANKKRKDARADAKAKEKAVDAVPSELDVARWIEAAKKLPLKITY